MASTLKEISQAAGTSVSTASLILNGRQAHRFTAATQEAVLQAADRLGYRPQRAAQSLVTGKTRNVALIVNSLANPFFSRYASLIQAGLMQHDYTAIPIEIRSEQMQEKGVWIDWIDQRAVDAVIDLQGAMRVGQAMGEVYERFSRHRPIVFRQLADSPELAPHAGVIVDYTVGFRAMAQHLAEIGCVDTGVVTVKGHAPRGHATRSSNSTPTRATGRNAGLAESSGGSVGGGGGRGGGGDDFFVMIRQALTDAGLRCEDAYFRGVDDERADSPDWCESTVDLLRKQPQIKALVVHNLDAVPAVLHGVRLAGRSLGADLALASFDDMPLARWLGPGITVVDEPAVQVAASIVDLVLSEIAGKRMAGHKRTLSTQLIVRGSTDPHWEGRDHCRVDSAPSAAPRHAS